MCRVGGLVGRSGIEVGLSMGIWWGMVEGN